MKMGEKMERQEKTLAIITARGGSKRIPKKNIKDFLGKPILAYSIEAALQAEIFEEVMVSTDSEEIAEVAKKYGALVPFLRSEKSSSDTASTADVLLEVLSEYQKRGREFEYFSCIYPTAPFIRAEKLKKAFWQLKESAESTVGVLPVVAFSYPPQRGYILNHGMLEMKWKENFYVRSQDLETLYHDCGQFYFYRTEAYKERKGQMVDGLLPYVMDEMEVQDIDNETDWKLAELKYQMLYD